MCATLLSPRSADSIKICITSAYVLRLIWSVKLSSTAVIKWPMCDMCEDSMWEIWHVHYRDVVLLSAWNLNRIVLCGRMGGTYSWRVATSSSGRDVETLALICFALVLPTSKIVITAMLRLFKWYLYHAPVCHRRNIFMNTLTAVWLSLCGSR